jgi:hypothetical protein
MSAYGPFCSTVRVLWTTQATGLASVEPKRNKNFFANGRRIMWPVEQEVFTPALVFLRRVVVRWTKLFDLCCSD